MRTTWSIDDEVLHEHGGRFVTFGRSVPLDGVPAATPESVVVL